MKAVNQWLHDLFEATVIFKLIDGALEALGGVLLMLVAPATLGQLAQALTQHELSQDPHDFVATHLLHSASALTSGTKWFAALYLLTHGLIKVGLAVGLIRRLIWAYPLAIAVLAVFTVYQVYRISFTHSITLVALTIIDIALIALTYREYRQLEATKV